MKIYHLFTAQKKDEKLNNMKKVVKKLKNQGDKRCREMIQK